MDGEEFRDVALERNERCQSGLNIDLGETECPPADVRVDECLISCYQLPCDVVAEVNECIEVCE